MSELRLTARYKRFAWLQAALKTPPTSGSYRRAAALLFALDEEGQSVGEVAELLGVSRQSVCNWSPQAFAAGFTPERRPCATTSSAAVAPPSGRRRRNAAARNASACGPRELGYMGMNWTVPLLRECLLSRTGLQLSEDTIRRRLQRVGLRVETVPLRAAA